MDSTRTRGTKSSATNSTVVFNWSKLCKLNSVSVALSTDKPKPSCDTRPSSSDEVSGSDDSRDNKVHPRSLEESSSSTSSSCSEEDLILRLFTAISALKCAYLQLQQAHIPYDPEKFMVADELMVSELESLSDLEEFYASHTSLSSEIQEYQELLDLYQSKLRVKESEIQRLKWELGELDKTNDKLQARIRVQEPEKLLPLNQGPTAEAFARVYCSMSKSIHTFAKPLIGMMKASGWDLNQSVSSMDSSVVYTVRSHKKYAFEAYLSRNMFGDAREEDLAWCHFNRVMIHREPFDALVAHPDLGFARFCQSMYVSAVSAEMESSFFGNLDQREFVLSGGHPRTPFYQSFMKMARWVWAVRVMESAVVPKAEAFYAKRGDSYCPDIMESVVDQVTTPSEKLTVGFTVTPGYRIGSCFIRCRVYLCEVKASTNNL